MAFQEIVSKLQDKNINLNPEEIAVLKQVFTVVTLKRGALFQEIGQMSTVLGIVTEGALYAYAYHEDGTERIYNFYYPNEQSIVFNYESYYKEEPSSVYIKCYEKCTLYTVEIEALRDLYDQYPIFFQIEKEIAKHNLKTAIYKIEILQEDSNSIKIKKLQDYYTRIFSLFPYSYIASYLGIHRNTFNRIFKEF